MVTMLITEGMQQVKIITDRIEKKRAVILKYLTRNDRFKDPLEADGGSKAVIAAEQVSIAALEANLVAIRIAIAKKNLETMVTVEGITMSVAEWLIWRREVADSLKRHQAMAAATIQQARVQHENAVRMANTTTVDGQAVKESNIIVNMDEMILAKESERVAIILGSLDAKLSIINATTTVVVA